MPISQVLTIGLKTGKTVEDLTVPLGREHEGSRLLVRRRRWGVRQGEGNHDSGDVRHKAWRGGTNGKQSMAIFEFFQTRTATIYPKEPGTTNDYAKYQKFLAPFRALLVSPHVRIVHDFPLWALRPRTTCIDRIRHTQTSNNKRRNDGQQRQWPSCNLHYLWFYTRRVLES